MELFEAWKSFGVSTLAVPNNVALALNLANDTSCYVTNKYNCKLAFFSSFTSKCFSWVIDWPSRRKEFENLFDNQELLKLGIISYILITLTFESRLIL